MTPTYSFNLVDEPWLPCVRADGTAAVLSLRDTLTQAHQLQSLAGDSPLQTAALHRFLLAILHRVFGPADEDEWENLWQTEKFDPGKLNAYLDTWQHRFNLFDTQRPFYQAADKRVKLKSTISLSHDRASGNNATLFDHHTDETGEILSCEQAARVVVMAQAFGLAGPCDPKQKLYFTDGTSAGGIIFLVEGDNLKQTFLLNMIAYPSGDSDMFSHTPSDKPAWEMDDPFKPDRTYPLGYLDYLTWQNRRIFLQPEQHGNQTIVRTMTMSPALRFESYVLDPMKHYRPHNKLGHVAVSFDENHVLWQDSASLFVFYDDIQDHFRPPATFRWLRGLTSPDVQILDKSKLFRYIALGMSKEQAKVFFFREERLPLPLAYLNDTRLVDTLTDALQYTKTIAFDLLQSARRTGMILQVSDGDSKKWGVLNTNAKTGINNWVALTGAERHYWASLEIPFQTFMVDLAQKDRETVLAGWLNHLRLAALNAFEQAAQSVGNDGRSFKAVVRGRSYLNYRLNQIIPQPEKEDTPV